MKKSLTVLLSGFLLISSASVLQAQVYSDKQVSKTDTVSKPYPYILPIWGKKAAALGFNLPYSAGLGVNYLYQKSDLTINNLQIGFNNGPRHNMDDIVRFNNATATSNGINIRPDVWVLPFLNVYGIFAVSQATTSVDFGIWVPDTTSSREILSMTTKADFQAVTAGFGMTPTLGVGGGFLALDMNMTWSDIDALDKPAFVFVFGPRLGKSFKLKKPERSIAVWCGGFRVKMNSGTSGSLPLESLFAGGDAQQKIENGQAQVEVAQDRLDTWWAGLSPAQQHLYQNTYDRANETLGRANDLLTAADNAVTNASSSSVQYSLDKRPTSMWNFIVGGQFQVNKHWMFRAEYGFLGTRQQFLGGLQYRFGL